MFLTLTSPRARQRTRTTLLSLLSGFCALSLLLSSDAGVAQTRPGPKAGNTQKVRTTKRVPLPRPQAFKVRKPPANSIQSLRSVVQPLFNEDGLRIGDVSRIEIAVYSSDCFPMMNENWTLRIGNHTFASSRYSEDGMLNTLIFSLSVEDFAQIRNGDPVLVQHGLVSGGRFYEFGRLNKGLLK
jgi:hypothetical protein